MNRHICIAVLLAIGAAQASAQEHQLDGPINIVGAKQLDKACHVMMGRAPKLSRAEVATGFGRPWSDDMETLRIKANNAAFDVCMEGNDGVSFTFMRGNGGHDLAIGTGDLSTVASATP